MKNLFLTKTRWLVTIILLTALGSENVWGETVTYKQSSTSAASVSSGTAPAGSNVTFSNTYSTKEQLISGKNMVLTLTSLGGISISNITLSMKSNKSAGAGKLSYSTDGGESWTYLAGSSNSGVAFNNAAWHGSYSSSYVDVSKDVSLSNVTQLKIRIEATTNSIYCQSFMITYTAAPTGTTVTVSPESITFPSAELSGEGNSGSTTVDMSVTNGSQSSGQYLCAWVESDDEANCKFTINGGVYSTCSGNATSINDLSVEYYAVSAGTFTGRITVYGYKANEDPVEKVIELSVTITSSCSSAVSIATGSPTNCMISASAASVSTCSGSRQVTISVTPNSCYAAPEKASVTSSGTTATWVSGPTLNADRYDYVYSFAENATGTATFNCSLSTKTTYTVQYNAGATTCTGGNAITGSHADDTKTCGTNLTLPGETFHTTGYTQTGWTKSSCGSQTNGLGGSYTSDAAQTFYPVWTANTYTVTWSVNGSSYTTTENVAYNTKTSTPANPSVPSECTGSTFMGWTENSSWASDSAPGDLFNETTPTITGDITFYAVFADEK